MQYLTKVIFLDMIFGMLLQILDSGKYKYIALADLIESLLNSVI